MPVYWELILDSSSSSLQIGTSSCFAFFVFEELELGLLETNAYVFFDTDDVGCPPTAFMIVSSSDRGRDSAPVMAILFLKAHDHLRPLVVYRRDMV